MSEYRDGRYRSEAVTIRKVDGLKIVFYDKESIYVYTDDRHAFIFHRWFAQRGSYKQYWHAFRKRIWEKQRVSIPWLFELAAAHDVQVTQTCRPLDLEGRKVKYRE